MAKYLPRKIVMKRAKTIKYNNEQDSFRWSHDVEVLAYFGFVQFDDNGFGDSCETEVTLSFGIRLTSSTFISDSGFLDS